MYSRPSTRFAHFYRTLALLIGLASFTCVPARAQATPFEVPSGFQIVDEMTGVDIYRKDYDGGSPDFVQVIDLSQGARVKLLHGQVQETRPDKGVYGGPDPRILSRSLAQYWKEAKSISSAALCITNGQFFYMPESPTRLPFPLKVDGEILSEGYAKTEFPEQKLMLEIWSGQVDIKPLSQEALYNSTAPEIVSGLTEDARKSPTKYVARTFVGVADQDGDGQNETLLIFNSRSSRQKDAADVLRSFGAVRVMMLDGGGSTQLSCRGKDIIASERLIPQALAVYAGNPLYREDRQAPMVVAQEAPPALEAAGVETAPAAERATVEQAAVPAAIHGEDTAPNQAETPPLVQIILDDTGTALAAAAPAEQAASLLANPDASLLNLSDLLYIPAIIGPAAIFLLFVLLRWRSTY